MHIKNTTKRCMAGNNIKNVCAGIVLYNPDSERLAENIKAARPQVEQIILVDNGTSVKKN